MWHKDRAAKYHWQLKHVSLDQKLRNMWAAKSLLYPCCNINLIFEKIKKSSKQYVIHLKFKYGKKEIIETGFTKLQI
jgi:hypothetical protein